jgi:hypothetical protein
VTKKGSVYHIPLPESEAWKLADLYRLPHTFEQCYSFVYCLDTDLPSRDRKRVDEAFVSYPFVGGYSYVNIYVVLANQIPAHARPRVSSIHKASPGWLDLALHLDAAIAVAKAVAIFMATGAAAAASYSAAVKLLANIKAERERARLKTMQIKSEQLRAIHSSCNELARMLGFDSLDELNKRTRNPEVSLKLLLAHYRRIEVLAGYVVEGKIILPTRSGD